MAKIDALVQDFLAQEKIAVVGVSDKRETGCNLAYRKFREAGYTVTAVNPRLTTFEGDPCYPNLESIPEKPDAVFILANPQVTEQIVQQCVELGSGSGHDQRIARCGAHVPREWHPGDPRQLPEPVSEAGFRSCHDAGDIPHDRLSQRQLEKSQQFSPEYEHGGA